MPGQLYGLHLESDKISNLQTQLHVDIIEMVAISKDPPLRNMNQIGPPRVEKIWSRQEISDGQTGGKMDERTE